MKPSHAPRVPARRLGLLAPLGLALALTSLAGCDELPFTPSSLVDKARIAAVAADPPVVPFQGGTTTLTALIVTPDGRDSRVAPDRSIDVEVRWRACNPWEAVFDPNRDCGMDNSLPLDTADGDTWQSQGQLSVAAMLEAFPPPQWFLDQIGNPDGMPGEEPDACPHSYQYAEIPVVAEVTVGDSRMVAIQRVRVTWEPVERKSPVLGGLVLDDVMADASQVTEFDGGADHDLTAWMERDSLDPVCAEDDPEQTLLEGLEIQVYVTAGELDEPNVDIAYLGDETESAETIVWTAPSGGEAVVWLVAVDSDGGMSWDRFDLQAR
jgi:hypothetical protein